MAHLLEVVDGQAKMFSVREVPWHGLGKILESHPETAADAMREAGLDFHVEKRTVATPTGAYLRASVEERRRMPSAERARVVEGQFAVVRVEDDKPLGIVGDDYHCVQNSELFRFFDTFVPEFAQYETAGVLRGGSVVWIMARVSGDYEVVPGDVIQQYILLSASHNGSRKIETRDTSVRVVCDNTLGAASPKWESKEEREKNHVTKIRHTRNASDRLGEAGVAMGKHLAAFARTRELFRAMAKRKMGREDNKAFIAELFPSTTEESKGKVSTRTENIRKEVLNLAEFGLGQTIRGVPGTLWATYNGVTEYVDHVRGIPENLKMDLKAASVRLDNLWFGTGNQIKEKALRMAEALV